MEYSNISNNNIYGSYNSSYEYQSRRFHRMTEEEDNKNTYHHNSKDSLTISEEAQNVYAEKIRNSKIQLMEIEPSNIRHLSSVSMIGYQNDFEKSVSAMGSNDSVSEEQTTENYSAEKVAELKNHFPAEDGTRTDTFTRHRNKMAATYQMMSDTIEEKYAESNRETEYYIAEDGSTQELTRKKEQEMLERAYRNHSQLMAGYTENLNSLKNVAMFEIYTDAQGHTITDTDENTKENDSLAATEKDQIKNNANEAFLSAISDSNLAKLMGTEGSWNHVKLDVGISHSQLEELNHIWDSYANRK